MPPQRLAIRLEWVRAELAMACSDGSSAVSLRAARVELAEQALPALRRHRVKSDIVLAAALCCSGDTAGAGAVADAVLPATERWGLVPLRWAVSCLLADIGSAVLTPGAVSDIRDRSAAFVVRHGGGGTAANALKRPGPILSLAEPAERDAHYVTLEKPLSMTIPGERLDAAVAEAVAGSRDALREVVETIRPIVIRYVRARIGSGSAVASRLTTLLRRFAWPPSRRCRAIRIRDAPSWPSSTVSPHTRSPTRIARRPVTNPSRPMLCRRNSRWMRVPNKWRCNPIPRRG